jgi:imidazolonepropionase-like amidohydrolase
MRSEDFLLKNLVASYANKYGLTYAEALIAMTINANKIMIVEYENKIQQLRKENEELEAKKAMMKK